MTRIWGQKMKNLWVEIKVLDYDLETIGFDFNVLNPDTKTTKSTSTVRMSLDELRVFVDALKDSTANINIATPNSHRQVQDLPVAKIAL